MFSFSKLFTRSKDSTEYRSADSWKSIFGLSTTRVGGQNAYKLVTVYSCIRLLADSVAMTELHLFERGKDDNRKRATTHPLLRILREPQENRTFFNWIQDVVGQLQGFGNAYAVIVRNSDFTVKELIFIPSERVSTVVDNTGELVYTLQLPNRKSVTLYSEDILHFRNMSFDGNIGISPISYHSNTLQRSYSEADYSKQYYENATQIGGVVSHPNKLGKEAIDQIKSAFSSAYGGTENAGKTAVLAEGMTYTPFSPISPTDADYIQSKKLTDADIANIFRVPVVLLNSTEASTYANVENLNLHFQMYSLTPIYRSIIQQMNMKLISPAKRDKLSFEFDPESLLTTTSSQKMEALDKGIKGGFITPNEARRKLNLNLIDGLDDTLIPLNMTPISKYDEVMIDKSDTSKPKVNSDDTDKEEESKIDTLERQIAKLSSELGRVKKNLN